MKHQLEAMLWVKVNESLGSRGPCVNRIGQNAKLYWPPPAMACATGRVDGARRELVPPPRKTTAAWTWMATMLIAGVVSGCDPVRPSSEGEVGDELDELVRLFTQIGPLAPAGGAAAMAPLVRGIREAMPVVATGAVAACLDELRPMVSATAGSNDFLIVMSIRSHRLHGAALVRTGDSPNWFRMRMRTLATEQATFGTNLRTASVVCATMPTGDWRQAWSWADEGFKKGVTHACLVGFSTNVNDPTICLFVVNRQGVEQMWIWSSLDTAHPLSQLAAVVCGAETPHVGDDQP